MQSGTKIQLENSTSGQTTSTQPTPRKRGEWVGEVYDSRAVQRITSVWHHLPILSLPGRFAEPRTQTGKR